MTGWVSARQDVDWKPLLQKIPQFEVFVTPPKDVSLLRRAGPAGVGRDRERMADRLPAAYVDPSAQRRPGQGGGRRSTRWPQQTDGLLKEADLYGTT